LESLKSDPRIGTQFQELATTEYEYTVLVCTTLCGCDAAALKRLSAESNPNKLHRTLLAVPASLRAFDAKAELRPYSNYFLLDGEYKLLAALNAAYLPRVYVFDRRGVLVWKSVKFGSDWMSTRKRAINEALGGKS
jgi:hypothetical protein